MTSRWVKAILSGALVIIVGCASGDPRWGQFHGDLASRGYQPVQSGFALSSTWISDAYKITSSSPVIGKDFEGQKVIYIGTTDADLLAIHEQDGRLSWKRPLGSGSGMSRIVSTPAVSSKGDIYVISNLESTEGTVRSTLHKVDPFSNRQWSYPFPDNGFTTGSPKVVTFNMETLVCVYIQVEEKNDFHGELFILRDLGKRVELLDRKVLGVCGNGQSGTESRIADAIENMKAVWRSVAHFPPASAPGEISLQNRFIDPTVAVVTRKDHLLIAVADNLCSVGAYKWNGEQLSVLWRDEHDYAKHSSPMVLPNGLMVFGRHDGKVIAYDIETGVKMWTHDAGQPVFATPAAPPKGLIFVVGGDSIHVLRAADGKLFHDAAQPRTLKLTGPTRVSPALTENRLYIATDEMLTVTFDLKTSAHDTNFRGNRWSSMAVDRDGSVFAVAADGTIHKYQGTH